MGSVLAERDRYRVALAEATRYRQRWERMVPLLASTADTVEMLRQSILDYDAASDRRGSVWDARVRIPVDLALKQVIRVLREIGDG